MKLKDLNVGDILACPVTGYYLKITEISLQENRCEYITLNSEIYKGTYYRHGDFDHIWYKKNIKLPPNYLKMNKVPKL